MIFRYTINDEAIFMHALPKSTNYGSFHFELKLSWLNYRYCEFTVFKT